MILTTVTTAYDSVRSKRSMKAAKMTEPRMRPFAAVRAAIALGAGSILVAAGN